jgi:3-deoxy-D-arabino-heptulosonate 7-phosphate (DAHP) synthase class II
MSTWSPTSWRALPILQQPVYLDSTKLHSVLDNIAQLPPLVSVSEVQQFKAHLQQVARGERFILQGGDCAERFLDCTAEAIESKIKILLQMALCVSRGAHIKTMQIARMAGQYAKPRSKDTEILSDGREVMSFRGDNINGFDANDREPDPNRLLLSYFHSASTLNHVRTLYRQGFTVRSVPFHSSMILYFSCYFFSFALSEY